MPSVAKGTTKIISKLTELGNSIYERLNTAKNDLANNSNG